MMKNVLVTGTSTGIGYSTALELARRGWRVFAGVRKEADGAALKREAEGEVHIVLLDVADEASIDSAAKFLAEQTGGELHGLVNNAGVYLGGPLELMRPDEIRKTLDVNVTGLLLLTRACLPLLRDAQGRIVNISSISGLIAMPGVSVYAASKHAVEAVTDALRVELQPFGIKVVAVEPGGVKTPIWDKGAKRDAAAREDRGTAETRELYAPIVRLLEKLNAKPGGLPPEALADVVTEALESAKPKNRYLVGKDAKALKLLTPLPDGLRDKTIAAKIWR
jgi:NAD(P)-dependent dehydrogenase (short-subunit alcohol dehydrogenase family)